jgi:hypothetical protein
MRLTSGEAKSTKHKMSNSKIFKVRIEFIVLKLIISPTTARMAKIWSKLPKSNETNNSQQINFCYPS